MAASSYHAVFDLAKTHYRWDITLPLVLILVGFILFILPQGIIDRILTRGPKGASGKIFGLLFFLLSGIATIYSICDGITDINRRRWLINEGNLSYTEGCIQNFHPMPEDGHDEEKIEINGVNFSYSDFEDSLGFHNTESHGGPVHADSAIRLWYNGNTIVRLEVRDHACVRAPDLTHTN